VPGSRILTVALVSSPLRSGSKEIFETDGSKKETVVYVRTGFIRMALRYGCDLVPVFVYGEKHCYHRCARPPLRTREGSTGLRACALTEHCLCNRAVGKLFVVPA
jgi:hypothetical protein